MKKKTNIDPAVSKAAAALGSKGGKNGTGAVKARPPAHYRRLAAIRQAQRLNADGEAKTA